MNGHGVRVSTTSLPNGRYLIVVDGDELDAEECSGLCTRTGAAAVLCFPGAAPVDPTGATATVRLLCETFGVADADDLVEVLTGGIAAASAADGDAQRTVRLLCETFGVADADDLVEVLTGQVRAPDVRVGLDPLRPTDDRPAWPA